VSISAITPTAPGRKPINASFGVLAFAAVIALLYFGRIFCVTMVISILIALLLEPAVGLLVRFRVPRAVSSFITCGFAALVVYLVALGAYTQLAGLIEDLPNYSARINKLVESGAAQLDRVEQKTVEVIMPKRFREEPAPSPAVQPADTKRKKKSVIVAPPSVQEVRLHREPTPVWLYLYAYFTSIYPILLMASFVPFLVFFMLSWRDHIRRSFLYLFSGTERHLVGKTWAGISEIGRAYILGNCVLGIIIAVPTCLFFFAIHLPYWLVVGVLSAFLSLVPYVGLPLAILPGIAAGLTAYDQLSSYALIAVVIGLFHLVALNLLYPKVVGARLHLNPLVVTIALMFWGTLWGGIGLLLAIPITACIKAVCDSVPGFEGYGKLLGD
jgi:predicted PurR-regulated permease PerM